MGGIPFARFRGRLNDFSNTRQRNCSSYLVIAEGERISWAENACEVIKIDQTNSLIPKSSIVLIMVGA